jgi:hypothetical protein
MHKHLFYELPIRSKLTMLNDIVQIIRYLHMGIREPTHSLLHDLRARALLLDEQIQHDVLAFISQIEFQYDYDPWHKITPEVQMAADRLIEDLGFPI